MGQDGDQNLLNKIPFGEIFNYQNELGATPRNSPEASLIDNLFQVEISDIKAPNQNPSSSNNPTGEISFCGTNKTAKQKKLYQKDNMFDYMNKVAKDVCYETLDAFVDDFEDIMIEFGYEDKVKNKKQDYKEVTKQNLRAGINNYIEFLENWFSQSFTRHQQSPNAPKQQNQGLMLQEDVDIFPTISKEEELHRYTEVKQKIIEAIDKHTQLKSKFLFRQYETGYRKELTDYLNGLFMKPANPKILQGLSEDNTNKENQTPKADEQTTKESNFIQK